jgi:type I restriction enzyme S subunit
LGELYFLKKEKDYCLSQRLFGLRSNKNIIDPKYLYYYLKSPIGQHQLKRRISGTAAEGIRQAELVQIEIDMPEDLSTQRRIASILSAFDNKIELNNMINQALGQMAQAIFKEWFVDFRFPGHEKVKMVDSELGKVPEGWEVVKFGDVFDIYGGGTPKTTESSYWLNGDIYWATPSDFTKLNTYITDDTERKITKKGLDNSSATLLPSGSVLMTSRATIGCLAISKVPISTNQGFISFVCKDYPSNIYLLHELICRVNEIKALAIGSTFPEISRSVMRGIALLLPPRKLTIKFTEIVGNKYKLIYDNMRINRNSSSLRDLLLPKLMSGEVRV